METLNEDAAKIARWMVGEVIDARKKQIEIRKLFEKFIGEMVYLRSNPQMKDHGERLNSIISQAEWQVRNAMEEEP